MGSERLSRALFAVGDTLGEVAKSQAQKDQEEAAAAREENMIRLRQSLSNEELDKRQKFEEGMQAKGFDQQKELQGNAQKFQAGEGQKDRSLRASENRRSEDLQRERWTREDRNLVERESLSQVNEIDNRILKIRDAVDKGEYPDPTKAEAEVQRLMDSRRQVQQSTLIRLADMGDPRYPAREAPAAGAAGAGTAQPQRAAQAAPTGVSVQPPPPAPSDIREEEKRRRIATPMPSTADQAAAANSHGSQGGVKPVRDLLSVGAAAFAGQRNAGEAKEQAAVKAFFGALTDRKEIPADVKATLLNMDPERRRKLGVSDEYVSYLK